MAEVPAVAEPDLDVMAESEPIQESGAVNRFDETEVYRRNDVVSGFLQLPWLRQMGLMVGLAGIISVGFMLVLWSQSPEYKPLYSNLESSDTSAVVNVLETGGIYFYVEPDTGMVLVPSKQLHEARMKVAAADVLSTTGEGYMILDQEQELGTSQFMETARYQRAIEGELARTITSLKNVRKSRVLLAIPKQSVFVRDNRKPSASVFVEVGAGRELEKHQVRSIMHLVSHSVPEMVKDDVTVVDQHGNLLSDMEDDDGVGQSDKQFEYSQKVEKELLEKIRRILEPVLGETKFNAQVAAEVDFTWVEETQEMFNPDLPAIRSEETMEELKKGDIDGGVPGALSNQPPIEPTIPEEAGAGSDGSIPNSVTRQRKQATRNYELDRTISHTKHSVGRISRLTIAVVLDDMQIADPETGEMQTMQWDDSSLQRLSQLIRDAVGFNAIRGDRVTVINEGFLPTEEIELLEPGFWTEAWFTSLTKQVIVALVIIFVTLFVLKPVLNMLAGPSAEDRMKDLIAEQELERLAEQELEQEEEMMQETVTLSGGEELLLPGPGDMFARQLDAIKALVDENPSRVAQVVKAWGAEV